MKKRYYKRELLDLQIELVKLQRHLIATDSKILAIFEGRDAAGKDGVIKRITQHMSPRETRVVALSKPSDRDRDAWYFQRFVPHLPVAKELVLFNRSWYNRAGVERVMGFCSEREYDAFKRDVGAFEQLLLDAGIQLFKFYLDISRDEQTFRLEQRRLSPLKQWKISPIDRTALDKWEDYSQARDDMLQSTHNEAAPWTVVRTDSKREARINIIRHILNSVDYPASNRLSGPDPEVLFHYDSTQAHRLVE